jgi:hypothetical protein
MAEMAKYVIRTNDDFRKFIRIPPLIILEFEDGPKAGELLQKWGQATQSPISTMVGQTRQSPNFAHVIGNETAAITSGKLGIA